MYKKFASALCLSGSLFCGNIYSLPALAAEDALTDASIVTYEKDYFANYSPVTLLDMLQNVPGVPEILNQNRQQNRGNGGGGGGGANNRAERGFGSGGDQILMNGKRLAGKANNIDDTLSRISAAQVERIELIRGAAGGLDVQSQGLVVNIVMMEGASTSTTFWKISGEYSGGHDFVPEFLISHSGSLSNLDYTFSFERKDNDFFFDRHDIFIGPAGTETGTMESAGLFNRDGYSFNTNLSYNFDDGAILRLNGLYEPAGNGGTETRDKTSDTLRPVVWLTDRDFGKWEIGGDYSRSLGNIGNLKFLFVVNNNTEDSLINRFKGSGAQKFEYTREITALDRSEKIFRASITRPIGSQQTIEFGGEGAFNNFDKIFTSLETDFANVPLSTANIDNVEIKENRYEVFANHTYNIDSNLVLQSSLTTEFSKIVADNIALDGTIDRRDTSFTYFKPRLNLRYDLTGQDQVRALVEKKVSQLDFDNFVNRYDQQAQKLRLGNTNIRPEQVWEFALTYEHRLANDAGSFEAEVFYHRYSDHITRVDFTEYVDFMGDRIDVDTFFDLPPTQALRDFINSDLGSDFVSKSGNVDKATGYGLKLKSNLRLGFIGLPQAVFSVGYTYEKKRTTDQFTQLKRNFDEHSDHIITFNFRHDITEYKIAYGFEGDIRSDFARYDIDFLWPNSPPANLKLFAEYSVSNDLKVRFEAEGVTRNRGYSELREYFDHIRFNDVEETELRKGTRPVELRISLQGTF